MKDFFIPLGNEDLLGELDDLLGSTEDEVFDSLTDCDPLLGAKPKRQSNQDLLGRVLRAASGRAPQPPRRLCTRDTKRGRVLACLLAHGSVERVTAEIGLARSAVLTYCYEIWRDHGVGYRVDGDRVTLTPYGVFGGGTPLFKD